MLEERQRRAELFGERPDIPSIGVAALNAVAADVDAVAEEQADFRDDLLVKDLALVRHDTAFSSLERMGARAACSTISALSIHFDRCEVEILSHGNRTRPPISYRRSASAARL